MSDTIGPTAPTKVVAWKIRIPTSPESWKIEYATLPAEVNRIVSDDPSAVAIPLVLWSDVFAAHNRNTGLRIALETCAAQFQFYADEHTKAGKLEKAETNQRFADLARKIAGEKNV